MSTEHLPKRFFAGTRGRILTLLRRGSCTVDELAQALEVTGNAIRVQLTALERDGLVQQDVQQQQNERRGVGKPAYVYRLTQRAEDLFPKAYDRVLSHLLNLLAVRMNSEEIEELLRAVGRRLASEEGPLPGQGRARNAGAPNGEIGEIGDIGDMRARLTTAVKILNQLGGLMEIEENEGSYSICGYSCPLAPLVVEHPNLCKVTQSMLADLVGVSVDKRCERSESLWCWFEVPKPEARGQQAPL
jgi:predicted ArsR family transcriptional regulator